MAILEVEQIKALILKPANTKLEKIIEQYDKLQLHVNGVGVQEALWEINTYENKDQLELRKKVAKSIKNIMSSVLRPTDKVFSAKGGSVDYNLPEDRDAFVRDILSNVTSGMSIRKWLQNIWSNKYMSDPNGIILIEPPNRQNDNPFPVYRPITVIHDYVTDGSRLEYVILKIGGMPWMDETKKYFRVIDDAMDYVFVSDKGATKPSQIKVVETVTFNEKEIKMTFKNHFRLTPAFTCSDLIDDVEFFKQSPIWSAMETADELLLDKSVHSIFKFKHGYPIFWAYLPDCPKCDGTGKVEGKQCSSCKGTKKDQKKDISDTVGLEPPEEGEVNIAPPAGYVSADGETWTLQNTEIFEMTKELDKSVWGTHRKDDATEETLGATFINVQPVNDRLNSFSDSAEIMERSISTTIIRYYIPNYSGPTVAYGRRYLVETPDQLWNKYNTARTAGAPDATLTHHLTQFYQSEFANDVRQQMKFIKLIGVEPFVHNTIQEVKNMEVSPDDYTKKVVYQEWVATIDDDDILEKSEEQLRTDLQKFVDDKKKAPILEPTVN